MQELAEKQFKKDFKPAALPAYRKAFCRRGYALMGLRNYRGASSMFNEGLRYVTKNSLEEVVGALPGIIPTTIKKGRLTICLIIDPDMIHLTRKWKEEWKKQRRVCYVIFSKAVALRHLHFPLQIHVNRSHTCHTRQDFIGMQMKSRGYRNLVKEVSDWARNN